MRPSIIGHPFATIGMGEQMRSCVRALSAVHVETEIVDAYKFAARSDREHRELVGAAESERVTEPLRVFHLNGDEVAPVLRHMAHAKLDFAAGYNIVCPAWELPVYPEIWVEALRQYDEIWAISRFVQASLAAAGLASTYVGQSAEVQPRPFLPRRHFGIRESAFVFLHFFDLGSYAARKNPEAVLTLFENLRRQRPFDDIQLVLKVKSGGEDAASWLAPIRQRVPEVVILSELLNTFETHSLIAAADCFVSLHRSEGFGRGPAEAMFLGRLAMATGWSGNADYMTSEDSLCVNYTLADVAEGAYPQSAGQQWAEADIDHATWLARRVLDDPALGRNLARRGTFAVRGIASNRSVGLNMLAALKAAEARMAERDASLAA